MSAVGFWGSGQLGASHPPEAQSQWLQLASAPLSMSVLPNHQFDLKLSGLVIRHALAPAWMVAVAARASSRWMSGVGSESDEERNEHLGDAPPRPPSCTSLWFLLRRCSCCLVLPPKNFDSSSHTICQPPVHPSILSKRPRQSLPFRRYRFITSQNEVLFRHLACCRRPRHRPGRPRRHP